VEGFPRLIEADVPTGVGDVRYSVSLAACMPFEMAEAEAHELMSRSDHG
jgi:hypothetical protein